jgi:hypothetical protein
MINSGTIGLIFTAVMCMSYGGCTGSEKPPGSAHQATEVSSSTRRFQMSPEKLGSLREHVSSLKIGESRDRVTALLGEPSREELDGPKRSRDWKCRRLFYDVTMVGDLPGNAEDKAVALAFDKQDGLLQILSTVDGIPSRGDEAACR